jgi:hypothetical protein
MRRLALEQNIGYDWWGAIRSSWLGRKLFRRQKDHPGKNYCSENVVEMLVYCGYTGRMPKWDNPQAVMAWMASQPDQFERVEGWEAPLWSDAAALTGSSSTTA